MGRCFYARGECLAKRLEQFAVDGVALRIVFRVPLHAERKGTRLRDPDRLDRSVLGDTFEHDPLARLENALPVQRIDADFLAAEDFGEGTARNERHLMTIREDHTGIWMDFAVLEPWHAMVHPPGQFPDLGMQRAAEGDIHLLQATADAE